MKKLLTKEKKNKKIQKIQQIFISNKMYINYYNDNSYYKRLKNNSKKHNNINLYY